MKDLVASPVFLANWNAYNDPDIKIIVNQGGTRSGKTYSIIQLNCHIAYYNNLAISIVSKTLPHLKKGCLRDFKTIMMDREMYDDKNFNKSDLVYKFKGDDSFIEFFSADDGAKLRGPGRDVLFINECNLLSYDEWKQLSIRTRQKIFIDYNPVDEFHWIYDKIITRKDCKFIRSCYLDNKDFLLQSQIEEIERLRDEDNNYWQVFGLGERAVSLNLIYPNFTELAFAHNGETVYGVDFGFNNPTAMVRVSFGANNTLFAEEVLYENELTNHELINYLPGLVPSCYDYIYADSAEPQRIQEIKNAGYNIFSADKAVKAGIDYLKRYKIVVHPNSVNLIKELKSYKWKEDRSGIILDEPVKYNDHLVDALRYAVFSYRHQLDELPISAFPNVHMNKFNQQRDNYLAY